MPVLVTFLRSVFGGVDNAFRPLAEKGALLFSALVIVMGLFANGWEWKALGFAVGVPGIVLPWLARRKGWSAGMLWLLVVIVMVTDFGVMSTIAETPGT